MQLRSASVVCGVGCEGEIGAHAVGRGQAGPLADQHDRDLGAERVGDRVAERHPAEPRHHQRRDAPVRQPRQHLAQQRLRVRRDRARGQAVGDDEHDVVAAAGVAAAAGVGGEQRRGIVRQAPAEVRPHEVLLAVLRRAGDREHGKTERRELAAQARGVERRMHGVAGARMGEAEFEQRRGGERRPAARQRDPRRR